MPCGHNAKTFYTSLTTQDGITHLEQRRSLAAAAFRSELSLRFGHLSVFR